MTYLFCRIHLQGARYFIEYDRVQHNENKTSDMRKVSTTACPSHVDDKCSRIGEIADPRQTVLNQLDTLETEQKFKLLPRHLLHECELECPIA